MARPRGNRKEARISVSFGASEYAQLVTMAARRDVSIAWLVRYAVQDLIRQEREANENPPLPLLPRPLVERGTAS